MRVKSMTSLRALLIAGATLAVLAVPAAAAPAHPRPILLAQADGEAVLEEQIAAAEQAVEEARAALREAHAKGKGVSAARRALREAEKALDDLRTSAGLPPGDETEDTATDGAATPPEPAAGEEAPPEAPAAETT